MTDLSDCFLLIDANSVVRDYGTFPDPNKSVVDAQALTRGLSAVWGVCQGNADTLGATWNGAELIPAVITITREQLAQQIADLRWQRETGGMVWHSRPVNTQRDAVAMLAGAIMQGETQGVWPASWKFNDGQFYAMTADEYRALGLAVRGHVSDAFSWEKQQLERLMAIPESELSSFIINP